MKKRLFALLSAAVLLSLAGCVSNKTPTSQDGADSAVELSTAAEITGAVTTETSVQTTTPIPPQSTESVQTTATTAPASTGSAEKNTTAQTTAAKTTKATSAPTTEQTKPATTTLPETTSGESGTLEDADADGKNRYELPVIPLI